MKSFYFAAALLLPALSLQAQLKLNNFPSREIGQLSLTTQSGSPNLVEGREFEQPQSVALDLSSTPPILYVADTSNNRVLAWKDATAPNKGTSADLAIGQTDLVSTLANGPGTNFSGGLLAPVGVAVDSHGNLYVADGGNNRILRYPRPFDQVAQNVGRVTPDLVIGQPDFVSKSAATTATGLATFVNGQLFQSNLAFDASGNLWSTDPGNNRVVRYNVSSLATGQPNGPTADLVLGQSSFTTNLQPQTRQDKTRLTLPSGLAFDSAGRLFVTDSANRVVVYIPGTGYQSGQTASRIMGIIPPTQAVPVPPAINEQTLGAVRNNQDLPPSGVFVVGKTPYVIDTYNNRILEYDPYDLWPAESAQYSPSAKAVIGQTDFVSSKANRGGGDATASTLAGPSQAAASSSEVYVVDTNNNRVLVFPLDGSGNMGTTANRVIGQLDFAFFAPNLVEGRELFLQNGTYTIGGINGTFRDGGGIIVDQYSTPPHLYIADTFNNRILGFNDARSVQPGQKADIVIGQVDLNRTMINSPFNDSTKPSNTGLFQPIGVTVDPNGNLYVCDSGNGRVLRFPTPFKQQQQLPDLVLGQTTYSNHQTDPDARTMSHPYGVVVDLNGNLLVSDALFNRVLFFQKPDGGDFTPGQSASKVVGQQNYFSINPGSSTGNLASPRGIAIDFDNRLYVADAGNNRVLVFDIAPGTGLEGAATVTLPNLNSPEGIYVSLVTGEVWVADTNNNRLLRYPRFDLLALSTDPDTVINNVGGPLSVSLDLFGNLLVAESSNRVTFYYPGAATRDAAAFTQRPLSPGAIASLYPLGGRFVETTASSPGIPYQTQLGDVQVTVNGVAAPLIFTSPTQINFIVPNSTPATGDPVDVQVTQISTGRLLAATREQVAAATPGLFTSNQQGSGQVAAVNDDGTVNSPTNGVIRGHVISLYGTGYGHVSNAPPDGAAAGKAIPVDLHTRVLIGTAFVPDANVQYSGLSPQFPGLWQINVLVPNDTAPLPNVPVVVLLGSYYSNDNGVGGKIQTFISVKDH